MGEEPWLWSCWVCHLGPGVHSCCVAGFKGVSVPNHWCEASLHLPVMHGDSVERIAMSYWPLRCLMEQ